MPSSAPPALLCLTCHPATPCTAALRLQAGCTPAPDGQGWRLRYELAGELALLRIPPPAPAPGAADGLWRHTCFEAFAGPTDDAAYREFNFSPAGDWAAYAFSAERVRDAAREPLAAPRIACARTADRLVLDAWLPAGALPDAGAPHRLGLAAVVETRDGGLSYWALQHPAPRPDFHHRGGWTAHLPRPEISSHIGL